MISKAMPFARELRLSCVNTAPPSSSSSSESEDEVTKSAVTQRKSAARSMTERRKSKVVKRHRRFKADIRTPLPSTSSLSVVVDTDGNAELETKAPALSLSVSESGSDQSLPAYFETPLGQIKVEKMPTMVVRGISISDLLLWEGNELFLSRKEARLDHHNRGLAYARQLQYIHLMSHLKSQIALHSPKSRLDSWRHHRVVGVVDSFNHSSSHDGGSGFSAFAWYSLLASPVITLGWSQWATNLHPSSSTSSRKIQKRGLYKGKAHGLGLTNASNATTRWRFPPPNEHVSQIEGSVRAIKNELICTQLSFQIFWSLCSTFWWEVRQTEIWRDWRWR